MNKLVFASVQLTYYSSSFDVIPAKLKANSRMIKFISTIA